MHTYTHHPHTLSHTRTRTTSVVVWSTRLVSSLTHTHMSIVCVILRTVLTHGEMQHIASNCQQVFLFFFFFSQTIITATVTNMFKREYKRKSAWDTTVGGQHFWKGNNDVVFFPIYSLFGKRKKKEKIKTLHTNTRKRKPNLPYTVKTQFCFSKQSCLHVFALGLRFKIKRTKKRKKEERTRTQNCTWTSHHVVVFKFSCTVTVMLFTVAHLSEGLSVFWCVHVYVNLSREKKNT